MLHLYKSNRLASLLTQMTAVLETGPQGPFDFELICAPDGIHERVKVALAEAHDVFAGEIVSPRNGVEQIISKLTSMSKDRLSLKGDAVLFFICRTMLDLLDTSAFAPVRQYLGTPFTMQKLMSLAGVLSGLFGEYAIYRPNILANWQKSAEDWQGILMGRVASTFAPQVGEGAFQAMQALKLDDATSTKLPRRIVVFGVSTLPPLFLQLISAASTRTEVHLFVMTPSVDYFESAGKRFNKDSNGGYQNSLLSLLGTQPSVFQDALVSVSSQIPVVEHEAFETAFSSTVLGEVQRGLMFNEPAASMADFAADDSVQFHQCTGIGREVDAMVAGVLHQIMDSGVAPSDVVVMAPDINEYAPWIEAAMMNTGVPFSISDRSVSTSPGASEATEILLQLMTSRLTVQEVFTLLEMVPVAARFSLDETDVRTAWKWCTDARIRSCIDATHRQHLGLEPFWENTWRFGLNRLLLGIAIDSDDSLFAGVSPLPAYVGTDTAKLGRLLTYLETLFALVEACRQPRSVSDWCALWDDQLGEFLTPTTDGFATVRSVFQRLAEQAAISGFDTDIDFAAFRTLLKGRIARARFTSGSGYGVRFSSFRFLRGDSVPIVALLGMDEGKFPLDARAPSFDIIAAKPQPGDKDMRHEGYHMFLEAVMAASRQLLVVYGGTSETTGQTVKPCVPVRQLLASVRDIVACAGQNADTPPIHLCHPVHAHASVYFEPDSPAFVNYQRNDFQAALAARQQNASNHGARHSVISATKSAQEVFARPSEIPDAGVTLALNDFFRFWKNPPLHYLANSLGLAFMAPEELVPDDEPVHLAGLDEWHVGQRFVEALLRRKDWTEVLKVVRALGIAPSGSLGEFYAGRVYDQAKRISHAVVNRQVVDTREEVAVDVTVDSALGPLRLLGTMPLYDGAVFEYRYGRVRDEIKIKLMLQYLVARTLEEKALEKVTNRPATIIGRGKDKFHPVYCELEMEMTEVRSLLSRISGWTILGLTKPLVFSAADGFAFAKRSSKLSPHAKDLLLQQTISTMTQMMQQQAPPEARALLDTGIIQQGCDEFGQIVASVVSPLLSHLKEGRL